MKRNIAVVGCGYWGKNLVRNFFELGSLVAVCDPDAEVAEKYACEYGVKNLSWEELLSNDEVAGIVLAVPAPLHASLAREALNSGRHVFVEKPIAMNKAEAIQMINTASERGVSLMVGHLLQYHPCFSALKEITDAGGLGQLKFVYSNRFSFGKVRTEEDVIWSFSPHDISMILSLAKQEPELIHAESSSILQEGIADIATVALAFPCGLNSRISASWLHPEKEQKLTVIGDSAMAVFDDTKPWSEKLAIYRHKACLKNGVPVLEKSETEFVNVDQSEPLKNECRHFMGVVAGKHRPKTDGHEGLSVLKVMTAAALSASQGLVVRLSDI